MQIQQAAQSNPVPSTPNASAGAGSTAAETSATTGSLGNNSTTGGATSSLGGGMNRGYGGGYGGMGGGMGMGGYGGMGMGMGGMGMGMGGGMYGRGMGGMYGQQQSGGGFFEKAQMYIYQLCEIAQMVEFNAHGLAGFIQTLKNVSAAGFKYGKEWAIWLFNQIVDYFKWLKTTLVS